MNAKDIRALVIETFGCGNAPGEEWLLSRIREIVAAGVTVVNVTQCAAGSVDMDTYATGMALKRLGVISAYDATVYFVHKIYDVDPSAFGISHDDAMDFYRRNWESIEAAVKTVDVYNDILAIETA